MLISSVMPTELFAHSPQGPAPVLHVTVQAPEAGTTVTVTVDGVVVGRAPVTEGAAEGRVEVALTGLAGRRPGEVVDAQVAVGAEQERVWIPLAEPGWTVWM